MHSSQTWSIQEQVEWKTKNLPGHLKDRLEKILGGPSGLRETLRAVSHPAARINTLKTTRQEAQDRLERLGIGTRPVPWSNTTVFLDDPQKRALGQLFEHQAGHLFLHDAASTLPVQALDPHPGDHVLDLCAAPGGKSTHILARMQDKGLLVANDPKPQRANHLVSTLDRMGSLSSAVTQRDGRHGGWPLPFDKVLVDAPCTNIGGIHHTPGPAFKQHKGSVMNHQKQQRKMLKTAERAVRPGGTIVYATCTLDPEENEANAAWFAEQPNIRLEPHDLPIKGRLPPDIADAAARDAAGHTLRIHPGDHGTDGFFVARFTKDSDSPQEQTSLPSGPAPARKDLLEPAGTGPIQETIQHNGIDPRPLSDTHALTTPARTWATRIDPALIPLLLHLRATRIGQLLSTKESVGPRLHFDAATRFGHDPEKPIELDGESARRWLAGEKIKAPAGTPRDRHRVVVASGQPIGASRAYGEDLPCFVPKHRRVPDDPRMHGWILTVDA